MKPIIYTVPGSKPFEEEKAFIKINGTSYPIENSRFDWCAGKITFLDTKLIPSEKEIQDLLFSELQLP